MKLLIDGDALIYPLLESCRSEALDESQEVVWAFVRLDDVLVHIEDRVASFTEEVFKYEDVDEVRKVIAFSCPSTECFRRDYYPLYKSNRKGVKPLGFTPAVERVKEKYETVIYPRLEADDILGILQTQPDEDTMIVGVDKDFTTVPGRVMHPDTLEVREYTEEEADQNHLRQTLIGDSTDGYPGAKGYGPKTVEKLGPLTWGKVVECFGNEYDALTQARLAKILRWEDWDPIGKEVRHWCPK